MTVNDIVKNITVLGTSGAAFLPLLADLIDKRIEYLEDKEPESEGQTHDTWSDNCDSLQDIAFLLISMKQKEVTESDMLTLKEQINQHQLFYGGLIKWKG